MADLTVVYDQLILDSNETTTREHRALHQA